MNCFFWKNIFHIVNVKTDLSLQYLNLQSKLYFFRHAEIFKKNKIQRNFVVNENEASFEMFGNISFAQMKSSKSNNYSAETHNRSATELWYNSHQKGGTS